MRKKRIILSALLLAALVLLAGCAKKTEGPDAVVPDSDPTSTDTAAGAPEDSAPESGAEDGAEDAPIRAEAAPLKNTEIAELISLSEQQLAELCGQPEVREEQVLDESGDYVEIQLRFGADTFSFLSAGGVEQLMQAAVYSDRIPAPRGVRIGDSLDSLLALFPDEGDMTLSDMGDGKSYRRLYGEVAHNSGYGIVEYAGSVPVAVRLYDEAMMVGFLLDGGAVAGVEYLIAAD